MITATKIATIINIHNPNGFSRQSHPLNLFLEAKQCFDDHPSCHITHRDIQANAGNAWIALVGQLYSVRSCQWNSLYLHLKLLCTMDDTKKYFVAGSEGPLGPYSVMQLCERGFDDDTFVWCEGMADWQRAGDIDELVNALKQRNASTLPPEFDRSRFNISSPSLSQGKPMVLDSECPKNHLVLAIIGIILFFPLGIPAVTNASNVYPSWLQGDRERAHRHSRAAQRFGLFAIIAGVIFNYFYSSMVNSLAIG